MSAKGRPLKAEMLRAAIIAGLSDTAFRLFVCMSLLANEDGVFRADPDFLHAEVYWLASPAIDLEAALRELVKVVEFFEQDGLVMGRIRPREPSRRSARVPKAPAPDGYAQVIDAYQRAFIAKRGVKPGIDARTGKAAKDLLAIFPVADAIACIEAAFDDPWFAQHGGALWQIANNPNRFRTAPPKPLPIYTRPTLVKAPPPPADTDAFEIDDNPFGELLTSRVLHG